MADRSEPKPPPRRIDAAVKAAFVAALRRGERREDAAASLGFSLMGLYGARSRDSAFAAQWTEALAASAAAERRADAQPREQGEVRIACANRRVYQRRRRRNVRFDANAQARFLTHFAETCDTIAAAAAAGVSPSTVHLHCRTDPAFAEAYGQALAEGYVFLDAEALRLGLLMQARLRAAVEAARADPRRPETGPAPGRCPECARRAQTDAEFDRIMKLLARHDRQPRRVERAVAFKPGGRRQPWTFDQAIELLDKRLRALGVRRRTPSAPDAPGGEEDGAG